MRSVFFSFVFLASFVLPVQADEILVCVSKSVAMPETKISCSTKDGKDKGMRTTLKQLYKDDWEIVSVVMASLSSSMVIYLSKD